MEFKIFENKSHYLEYLQIFVYTELIINGKDNVNIDDYDAFELIDKHILSFNEWVISLSYEKSIVLVWLEKNSNIVEKFKTNFPTTYKPKVSIWSDRNKTDYYKKKLQDSFLFENYIAEKIEREYGLNLEQYLTPEGQYELGENALGIEIKNDTLIQKYGNIYIEYEEKSKASNHNYVYSGILKKDNCKYFLIGTVEQFYIFKKSRLIEIFNEEIKNLKNGMPSVRKILFKQIATSKGYVYPVKNTINDTITMDSMIEEIKQK